MFVTLTTRRMRLSASNARRIRDWFGRLRHRNIWKALGGIYQIELGTIDDLGMCNLHIHAIVDSDFMPQSDLSDAWKEITGSYIVHIERCLSIDGALNYLAGHMGKTIAKPEFADLVNATLKNIRLVQGFGDRRDANLSIDKPVCPWCGAVGSVITQFEPLWGDCVDRREGVEPPPIDRWESSWGAMGGPPPIVTAFVDG